MVFGVATFKPHKATSITGGLGMSDGVVIFSQRDVDTGLMGYMDEYADEMGLSVPDMLRQVFVRRLADDLAHVAALGELSEDFKKDAKMKWWMDEHGVETILDWMLFVATEKKCGRWPTKDSGKGGKLQ